MAFQSEIERLRAFAESKNGNLLSNYIINRGDKLSWKCDQGHIWSAKPSIVEGGSWCPRCAHVTLKQVAEERGGELLSQLFVSNDVFLTWKCSEGHRWADSPYRIMQGFWCPTCTKLPGYQSMAEVTRKFIREQVKIGCINLKLREEPVPVTSPLPEVPVEKKVKQYNIVDMWHLAVAKHGKCLSSEYQNLKTPLEWECSNGHVFKRLPQHVFRGQWCTVCCSSNVKNYTIEHMHELAKAKGGECFSTTYKNIKTRLELKCVNGHSWTTSAECLVKGTWCRICTDKSKSIDDMREIAAVHNGECLSLEYKNSNQVLSWKCSLGHVWESRAKNVLAGAWCHECGKNKSILKKKSSKGKIIS